MEVINAIGRRKSAVARVFVSEGTGKITINKRDLAVYFPSSPLQYLGSLIDSCNSLIKVDDMNAIALHEDIRSHSGIPFAAQVAEVATSFEKLFKICS